MSWPCRRERPMPAARPDRASMSWSASRPAGLRPWVCPCLWTLGSWRTTRACSVRCSEWPRRHCTRLLCWKGRPCFWTRVAPLCREPAAGPGFRPEPDKVAEIRRCLETRYAEDMPLAELARLAGCSPCHLNRIFVRAVGMPPHEYQSLQRVRRVKECLREGRTLAESAAEAGFADQSHMSRCFRKTMGMTPGTFERGLTLRRSE